MSKRVVIIGGGAAGFFFAANYGVLHPDAQITLLEKSKHLLDKVRAVAGAMSPMTAMSQPSSSSITHGVVVSC
jgi:predicted flavoprotein YhiN